MGWKGLDEDELQKLEIGCMSIHAKVALDKATAGESLAFLQGMYSPTGGAWQLSLAHVTHLLKAAGTAPLKLVVGTWAAPKSSSTITRPSRASVSNAAGTRFK
jgi:hypothetical protein